MFLLSVLLALAAALALGDSAAPTPPPAAAEVAVRLIAFNDLHGNLHSPGTLPRPGDGAPTPVGGADVLAAYVADLRAGAPHSVVVAAGDLVGASPLVSALLHDEPTVEVLNRLGLDITAVGNHEFDAGRDELLRKQRGGCHPDAGQSCQGAQVGTPVPFEGAHYTILAANVIDRASGEPLLPATTIRRFDGIPVGFVGLTLAGTAGIVSPLGIRGLEFRDEVATVNAAVEALARAGVRSVVVLIHQGGVQQPDGVPMQDSYDRCGGELQDDQQSPIRALVRQFDDRVDLVISGHSHTVYNCRLPNRSGRRIPVTQALSFGRMLTRIDGVLQRGSGRLVVHDVHNLLVDRADPSHPPLPAIRDLIERYDTLTAPIANRPIGALAESLPNDETADGERPLADLVADAQLAAARAIDPGVQLALINPGGVRGTGWIGDARPLPLRFGDAFTVQPFGNSVQTVELAAEDFRQALEQQFPGCAGQTQQKLLQFSAGVHAVWRAEAPPCAHMREFTLPDQNGPLVLIRDGELVAPTVHIRLALNSFLAAGGDGFGAFTRGAPRGSAGQDIDILARYLEGFAPPAAPYQPRAEGLQRPRIRRLP